MTQRTVWSSIDLAIVAKVLGAFAMLFSLTMLLPLAVGAVSGETFEQKAGNTVRGFGIAAAIGVALGLVLVLLGRKSKGEFFRREGILTVACVWLLVGALGALPFWISGWFSGFWDAFFESVSGLTTTGSSVLGAGGNSQVEELPPSLLFWRSWLHWLGGLGIVVMFLAFLPALGITEKTLFQAEVAGVSKEGLRPRIRHSTLMLFRIYVVITSGLFLAYLVCGMGVFDAVNHAFSTIATGGFSTKNASIGGFHNVAIEIVAVIGMLMAATNFGLYHRFTSLFRPVFRDGIVPKLKKLPTPKAVLRVFFGDPEFRLYAAVFALATVAIIVTLAVSGTNVEDPGAGRVQAYQDSLVDCARAAPFQVSSMISSTGFANSNTLAWPLLAQAIILILMLAGGCSGSTGGGLKMARVMILFKLIARSLRRFVRPRAVEPLRVGQDPLDQEIADRVVALAALWIATLAVGSLAIQLMEPQLDLLGSFSSMVTCLCNMGPAFTSVVGGEPFGPNIGSYGSFGEFGAGTKAFMAFVMVLGRLEIYTALIIVFPGFWKD
ncbi:MAG: hypothetical protein CMJ85_03020 [Planctomycetes bacterium]|nr:hypothetical protein [Planctomycetota bacterium]